MPSAPAAAMNFPSGLKSTLSRILRSESTVAPLRYRTGLPPSGLLKPTRPSFPADAIMRPLRDQARQPTGASWPWNSESTLPSVRQMVIAPLAEDVAMRLPSLQIASPSAAVSLLSTAEGFRSPGLQRFKVPLAEVK